MNHPRTGRTDQTSTNNNIPQSHIQYKYIQSCADGQELERIYKTLICGTLGSFPYLETLTLDRIRHIHPNSEILRLALPISLHHEQDQPYNGTDSNSSSTETAVVNNNSVTPTLSVPMIVTIPTTNEHQQIEPQTPEQWKKFEDDVSRDFNDDRTIDEVQPTNTHLPLSNQNDQPSNTIDQYYIDGKTAFETKNYEESIELYTQSLHLDKTNPVVYMDRAIAHFQLNNFDASIKDCSQVLSMDANHLQALMQRASCFRGKQQPDEALNDLKTLLALDSNHSAAQDLWNIICNVRTSTGVSTPIAEEFNTQQFTSVLMNDDTVETANKPLGIGESHQHNCFEEDCPSEGSVDLPNILHDDENDEIPWGDEAVTGIDTYRQDEDDHARIINVSPSPDNEPDLSGSSTEEKFLGTSTKQTLANHVIDRHLSLETKKDDLYALSRDSPNDELYDRDNYPSTRSTINSSQNQNNISSNSGHHYDPMSPRSSPSNTPNDSISDSSFSSTIQTWLRDLISVQSTRRVSSYYDRPWTRSSRPWSLDGLQRDIDRYQRYQEYTNVIEVSKLMLKNGVLDYHHHTEYIVNTLIICAECYSNLNDHRRAIQYATEALQYDRINSNALSIRAQAFEKENFLLLSYIDYTRMVQHSFSYYSGLRACERLASQLKSINGETWREQLPSNLDDDGECFFTYIKTQDDYQTLADQLYHEACFVLAIRCYTLSLESEPNNQLAYTNRAACYCKVFEPRKAIADCDRVLKDTDDCLSVLYCKARAYKILRDDYAYESMLKKCLVLQPNNQILLAEYHTGRYESIPRKKRRLRPPSMPTKMSKTTSLLVLRENHLSFEELEQIRSETSCDDISFDFAEQFELLQLNDIKSQCSFVLHIPETNFITAISSASTKLIEIVTNASQTMILAEQVYQQEHSSFIVSFSYIQYCFRLLVGLARLPLIDTALSMLDGRQRIELNELLAFYSSISLLFPDVDQLNRLK